MFLEEEVVVVEGRRGGGWPYIYTYIHTYIHNTSDMTGDTRYTLNDHALCRIDGEKKGHPSRDFRRKDAVSCLVCSGCHQLLGARTRHMAVLQMSRE